MEIHLQASTLVCHCTMAGKQTVRALAQCCWLHLSSILAVFRRVNSDAGHADDVFVHENGLVFASSSDPGGGFWIMRHTPGTKGTVEWTACELDGEGV